MKHFADSDTERNGQEETGHTFIRTMIGLVHLMLDTAKGLACALLTPKAPVTVSSFTGKAIGAERL